MNNYFLTIAIFFLTFTSCDKDENATTNSLEGTWKLTEILADPGDGSGTFNPISSNKKLIFDNNGNITSNGLICDMSVETNSSTTGTYSISNSTINSANCQNSTIKYELNGNTLILVYPCFEACKSKYTKIQ